MPLIADSISKMKAVELALIKETCYSRDMVKVEQELEIQERMERHHEELKFLRVVWRNLQVTNVHVLQQNYHIQ